MSLCFHRFSVFQSLRRWNNWVLTIDTIGLTRAIKPMGTVTAHFPFQTAYTLSVPKTAWQWGWAESRRGAYGPTYLRGQGTAHWLQSRRFDTPLYTWDSMSGVIHESIEATQHLKSRLSISQYRTDANFAYHFCNIAGMINPRHKWTNLAVRSTRKPYRLIAYNMVITEILFSHTARTSSESEMR